MQHFPVQDSSTMLLCHDYHQCCTVLPVKCLAAQHQLAVHPWLEGLREATELILFCAVHAACASRTTKALQLCLHVCRR